MKTSEKLKLPMISTYLKMGVFKARKTFIETSMQTIIKEGNILIIDNVLWSERGSTLICELKCAQISVDGKSSVTLYLDSDLYDNMNDLKEYFSRIFKKLGSKF